MDSAPVFSNPGKKGEAGRRDLIVCYYEGDKYIDICGVSEQELYDNLDAELHEFANVQGVTYEEICVG